MCVCMCWDAVNLYYCAWPTHVEVLRIDELQLDRRRGINVSSDPG